MNEFKTNTIWVVGYYFAAVAFLAIGFLAPRPLYIGCGAVFLVVAIYQSVVPIVRLKDDHFVMKVAPAAPKKLVLYREMEKIEEVKPKKVFVHCKVDGRPKKVRLPMSALSPQDRSRLIAELTARAFA